MEHVRIDEGIKRGKRKPPNPPKQSSPPAKAEQGKLANLDIQTILQRYIAGATSTEIAKDLNVTRQGLAWWMRKHAEEDWKEAQVIQAIERKEKAQEQLDDAPDALSLARARESLRSAQWDLERVCSRIFGPKQEVTVELNHHLLIEHGLADSALQLFESMRGVAPQPPGVQVQQLEDKPE